MKQVIGTAECREIKGCYDPEFKEVTLRSTAIDFGITILCRLRSELAAEMEKGEFYDITLESVVRTKGKR